MRIIEITAAELADRLVESGTKFEMEPDRIIWPNGTTTKKSSPSRKKGKKNPPAAHSKHGLYGTIVAQFGNKKVKQASTATSTVVSSDVITIESSNSSVDQSSSAASPEKTKQTRRCKLTSLPQSITLSARKLILIYLVVTI